MADQQQNSGPYSVYGRRTEHEAEVRVAIDNSLDRATAIADSMVDSRTWHQASVRDRNDQTVHVGRKDDAEGQRPNGYDPTDTGGGHQPAA